MTSLARILLISLSMVFLLSACQSTPVVPDRVTTLDEFFAPPSSKVISTADSILVKGVRTNYYNGHLRADFKILNNRGRRNVINYRVQWLDNEGMVTGVYGPWTTISFEGQQESVVTVVAPNHHATDYRLELQTN